MNIYEFIPQMIHLPVNMLTYTNLYLLKIFPLFVIMNLSNCCSLYIRTSLLDNLHSTYDFAVIVVILVTATRQNQ